MWVSAESGGMSDLRMESPPSACGYCGYDLSGGTVETCPECGRRPSDWTVFADKQLLLWRRVNLVVCSLPLVWMILLNIAFIAARISLGRWPIPPDHSRGTLPLMILSGTFSWVLMIAMCAPGVVWFFIGRRLGSIACPVAVAASLQRRAVAAYLLSWGATYILAMSDPVGAFNWMRD